MPCAPSRFFSAALFFFSVCVHSAAAFVCVSCSCSRECFLVCLARRRSLRLRRRNLLCPRQLHKGLSRPWIVSVKHSTCLTKKKGNCKKISLTNSHVQKNSHSLKIRYVCFCLVCLPFEFDFFWFFLSTLIHLKKKLTNRKSHLLFFNNHMKSYYHDDDDSVQPCSA